MIKLLLSAWLMATVAVAQTAPKTAPKGGANAPKPTSSSATSTSGSAQASGKAPAKPSSSTTKATAGSPQSATGSVASAATKPASSSAPARPLPEQPLRTKLRNESSLNPNYEKEKARGRGVKREYTPRRTKSGARKDTMNQRKPGQ